jgi:tetratricopeptide (TPR) repeat protein
MVQVFYNVLPTAPQATGKELLLGDRRSAGGNGLPIVTITDEPLTREDPFKRRLLIQFDEPLKLSARAGRKREYLELILEGLGAAVPKPIAFQKPVDDGKNFLVQLQSSENVGDQLQASIPAALQEKDVFTSRRVVNGKNVYDINLGFFATQDEADKAQKILARRFPSAQTMISKTLTAPSARTGNAAQAGPKFTVSLQSSTDPNALLMASIPALLQDSDVFTSRRVEDGKAVFDFNLGTFASKEEAEAAQRIVLRRFPDAKVVPLESTQLALAPAPAPPVPVPMPVPEPVRPAAVAALPPPVPEPAPPAIASAPEIETSALQLMEQANAATDRADYPAAVLALDSLLNLPPNSSSRKAQAQIGITRLKAGERDKARGEFETFLKLYPTGPDSDQVREYLVNLPPATVTAKASKGPAPTAVINGSFSSFYYGGESKTRSEDFVNSPLSGLPELASQSDLSSLDQNQLQTNFDLNWRYRDAERDQRFVLRESYSSDFIPGRKDRERLSALYYEVRDFSSGASLKLGRQSPTGGGILYRFDGGQAGYRLAPKWKVNATYGVPTDALLDAKRSFYGLSLDAEALTQHTSGTVYMNEQTIDGQTDRSAVGAELRYFNQGLILSGQMDYDQVLQGLNIASMQGSWQFPDNSVANFLLDRRATPVRSLGNALFFQDPTQSLPVRSIRELLDTTPIDMLRSRVNNVTPFQSQASLGYNRPLNATWQTGANVNYTNVDEIKPVEGILPNGQASTGDLWGVGLQLIGSNLYSARDTHVFSVNYMSGPTYIGQMFAYNNLTGFETWQVEPSIRYYTQTDSFGTAMNRLTPGLRVSYRGIKRVSIESELSYEMADTTSSTRKETSTRMFYYLGGRFDF